MAKEKKSAGEEQVKEKEVAAPKKKAAAPALKPGLERRIVESDEEVMELQRKKLLWGWNPITREAVIKKEG